MGQSKSIRLKHRRAPLDCNVLAIRDILEHAGVFVTPYLCAGLGSNLNFNRYRFFPRENIPFFGFWGNNNTYNKNLESATGIALEKITHDDPRQILNIIIEELDNNNPVLVNITSQFLKNPNLEIDSKAPARYEAISHSVIYGYDLDRELIYLTNGLINKGMKMSIDRFLTAISIPIYPFSPKPSLLKLNQVKKFDISQAVVKSLQSLAHNFLEGDVIEGEKVKGEIRSGVGAYEDFLSELRIFLARTKNRSDEKVKKYFFLQCYALYSGLAAGSRTFHRREYSRFLQEAQKILETGKLDKLTANLETIASDWRDIARSTRKTHQMDDHSLYALFTNIYEKMGLIYEKEQRWIDQFAGLAATL